MSYVALKNATKVEDPTALSSACFWSLKSSEEAVMVQLRV